MIRKAKASDFLTIAALDRAAWDDLEYPEKLPDGEHTWRMWCEHALVWVAEEQGEIVGALLAFPTMNSHGTSSRSEDRDPAIKSRDGIEQDACSPFIEQERGEKKKLCLHKVFVSPDARGKGIGKQLFSVLLEECDVKNYSAFLTVAPFNENALALYEKMGFQKAEYVEGFYRSDEHRWVMKYMPMPPS